MSRETRMAIEHSTPMPQRSESGASPRYETKVFSVWEREAWGEAQRANAVAREQQSHVA